MRDEEPTWRPLTSIDMVTAIAVQSLAFAQEHLDTVGPVRPYVLDDHTVARMLRIWGNAKDNNALFADQARRWQTEAATQPDYHQAVTELVSIVDQERGLIDEIIATAQKLEQVTIERLLAKSDFEVGLDALTNRTTDQ